MHCPPKLTAKIWPRSFLLGSACLYASRMRHRCTHLPHPPIPYRHPTETRGGKFKAHMGRQYARACSMIDHACMSLDEERKEATPETVEVQGCTASQRSRNQATRASARASVMCRQPSLGRKPMWPPCEPGHGGPPLLFLKAHSASRL
jgi:hypothetical protein